MKFAVFEEEFHIPDKNLLGPQEVPTLPIEATHLSRPEAAAKVELADVLPEPVFQEYVNLSREALPVDEISRSVSLFC